MEELQAGEQVKSTPPSQNVGRIAGGAAAQADFFIPDLCATRPAVLSILLSELLVLVHVLAGSSLTHFDWDVFALGSLLVLWIVLLSSILLCRCRALLSRLNLPLAAFASLLVVAMVTLVISMLSQSFLAETMYIPEDVWWVLRNVLVATVLAGTVLRYFYLQQQLKLQQQLEMQARLDSLRTRIRPHFLFNTLNSIASLIISRPETAERAVEDLAELFRTTLKENTESNTVEDEVRLTRLYLGIESLRLEDRLQVHWEIDENALGAPMPALVLQPLVENAVYHGISRLPKGGCIDIRVTLSGDDLSVLVDNPVPASIAPSAGSKMALPNVAQRLQATFGLGATLVVFPGEENFRVELRYTVPTP